MDNVMFLLIALGTSLVGSLIVWARHRQPTGITSGIDRFEEQRKALAPEEADAEGSRRSGA